MRAWEIMWDFWIVEVELVSVGGGVEGGVGVMIVIIMEVGWAGLWGGGERG